MVGLLNLAGPLVGLAGKFMERRAEVGRAKHQVRMAKAEWDTEQARTGAKSWRPAAITVLVLTPLVMLFTPFPEVHEIAVGGFERMQDAPEWYQIAVGAVLASAFGIKDLVTMIGRKK